MAKRSLHTKLDGIRSLVVSERQAAPANPVPDRYRLLADRLGGSIESEFGGSYCLVRTTYYHDYQHGRLALGEVEADEPYLVSAFTPDDAEGSIDPSSMLFFDTETTGLGGAGTVAFLVGLGSATPDGFEVRQYLIPDYSDEAAMLEALSAEFDDNRTLVSYNGAAFDAPLLRDRLIVNRVGRHIPFDRHVDLLHSVRRLFRRRLGDCSLGNVERELLGFERVDDIPGYLVPSVYFDWLGQERLDGMAAVLEHNRFDIVSLFFLASLLSEAFQSKGKTLESVDDLHSLSRVFGRRRNLSEVIDLSERISDLSPVGLAADMALFQAAAFKRTGDYGRAVTLWEQIAGGDSREACQANIELAMYHEHRRRDIPTALSHARRASAWSGLTACQRRLVDKRLDRLGGKLKR